MGDPAVTQLPVADSGEPLVDVTSLLERVRVDARKHTAEGHYRRVRLGVAQRLAYAESLLPDGAVLLFVEGYRPLPLQSAYFTGYRDALALANPDWDAARLDRAASRYISPPRVAPHSAGAAVDLTLCDPDDTEWDLGTPMNEDPERSAGRCYTRAVVPSRARAARNVLAAAMAGAGFVNYPTEWWHWSFGDRYWAMATGAPAAVYGPVAT